MPVLKPDMHLHDLPVSCHIIPCNWQDRKEHNLSFTSLAQLSQGPEVPLGCLQPSCWDAFAAYLQNQWRIIISGLYQAGKFLCDVPYLVSRELTHLLCAGFSEHVRPLKRELPITATLLFFINCEDCDDWFRQSISSSVSSTSQSFYFISQLHH